MARKVIRGPIEDEAGNRLGTSGTEIRVYTDEALTTPATLYADTSSGSTIAQPLIPNAGGQTVLTANTLTTDTVITVADVSTFHVGDRLFLWNGTTTTYRTITAINAGAKTITLSQTVGTAYSSANTQVGGAHMQGNVSIVVADTADTFIQVKDVASGVFMDAIQILTNVPAANTQVQEEGTLVNTRAIVNYIGASVTATDDGANSRINITITGLQADGAVGTPSIGFVSDTDTGFYRIGANDFAAVTGGHKNLEYVDVASAVNFLQVNNAVTGTTPSISAAGTDASIGINIVAKTTTDTIYLSAFSVRVFRATGVASGVNNLAALAASTGNSPQLIAEGSDTNIDLALTPQGTGKVRINTATVALGGGAAASFGTIGGSGPATTSQNAWFPIRINGTTVYFIPVWL